MSRKEALFENLKNAAERKGEPFPYNNLEEWEADAPKNTRLNGFLSESLRKLSRLR